MADMREFLSRTGSFVKDTWQKSQDEKQSYFMQEGANDQKDNDILSAIMGFIELKATDVQMYDLLQKYFGIDSITEAKNYVKLAKDIYTINYVRDYLRKQSNGNWDVSYGSLITKLRHELEENSKYQMKDPAKIIAALKKEK